MNTDLMGLVERMRVSAEGLRRLGVAGAAQVLDAYADDLAALPAIKNGWAELPAGTLWTVTYARSGLSIESDACSCCGIKVYVRGVNPRDFEVLTPTTEESP